MADALWMKIREVDWETFPAADNANMPSLFRNLASRKLPRAMKASHQIWRALCGGGEVHPAALPSIPFLVEIIPISDIGVQDGIIDVLYRIAKEGDRYRDLLITHQTLLKYLTRSKDAIVAAKAEDLIALLELD